MYKLKTASEALTNFLNQSKEKNNFFSSGFDVIDNFSSGFRAGQLSVLGARPGIGKTTFLANVVNHLKNQIKETEIILFFSLEMSAEEVIEKLVSINSGIPLSVFKGQYWLEEFKSKLESTILQIAAMKILFFDESHLNIDLIIHIITDLQQKGKTIKSVMIDHIQLLEEKSGVNKYEKISKISRGLKNIAKTFNCNVLTLSQISRDYEKTKSKAKRPMLSDLRDSGSIEQDADSVFFLSEQEEFNNDVKILHLKIAKNRNGKLGEGYIQFDTKNGKMSNSDYIELKKEKKNE